MSKYRAQKMVVDGITFASKREAEYYKKLKALENAGNILCLTLQPRFILQPAFTDRAGGKHRKIEYAADFSYFEKKGRQGALIVVDVKGFRTPIYKLKKKLLLYKHQDIVFEEV